MVEEQDDTVIPRLSTDRRNNLQCKFCLSNDLEDPKNPVISPCKCSGSMKFVHLQCLKSWIRRRISVKESSQVTLIKWKSLSCELCRAPYPFAISFNGQIFELVDCALPNSPYIVFEHSLGKSNTQLFVVSFAKQQEFTIGRSGDNDIVLDDTCVSRKQAILLLQNDGVYLKDLGSKFGTLVLMQRPYALKPNETLCIQCGNILLNLSVETSSSPLPAPKASSEKSLTGIASYLPEECLPGYGKHQLLVVKKSMYDQLSKGEKSLRRSKTPEDISESGAQLVKLNRSSTSVFSLLQRVSQTMGFIKFNQNFLIIRHAGDFANDIDDEDCK